MFTKRPTVSSQTQRKKIIHFQVRKQTSNSTKIQKNPEISERQYFTLNSRNQTEENEKKSIWNGTQFYENLCDSKYSLNEPLKISQISEQMNNFKFSNQAKEKVSHIVRLINVVCSNPEQILIHLFQLIKILNCEKVQLDCSLKHQQQFVEEQVVDVQNQKDYYYNLATKVKSQQSSTSSINKTQIFQKMNSIQLENMKLKQQIQLLSEKFSQVEKGQEIHDLQLQIIKLKQSNEDQIQHLVAENDIKDKVIEKNSILIQNLKALNSRVETESKTQTSLFAELNLKYKLLNETNIKLIEQRNQFRESYYMAWQDLTQHSQDFRTQAKLLEKTSDKLRKLQSKIDKLTIMKSKEIEIQDDPRYDEQVQVFAFIQEIAQKDKTYFKQMRENIEESYRKFVDEEGFFNLNDPISRLGLNYPNFWNLIEHQQSQFDVELKNIQNRQIDFNFLGTLRTILDNKYEDILTNENPTKFVDFVFSWLSVFQIDSNTRQIKTIEQNDLKKVDEFRVKFYLDLISPRVDKIWDCLIFREFINEKTAEDEIYFYLYVRNIILRGQFKQEGPAHYNILVYVPLEYCEFIIETIMNRFSSFNVNLVKKLVREKSTTIFNKGNFIDEGFVSRILLDFYRQERKNRYKLFRDLFASVPVSNTSRSLNIKQFRKLLISVYPDLSETQIVQTYREAWIIGQQVVNIDSFYAASIENGLFVQQLMLHTLYQLPSIDPKTSTFNYGESSYHYTQFFKNQEQIQLKKDSITKFCIQFGNEKLFYNVKKYFAIAEMRFIDQIDKFHSKNITMLSWNLADILTKLINTSIYNTYLHCGEHQIKGLQAFIDRSDKQPKHSIEFNKNFYKDFGGQSYCELDILPMHEKVFEKVIELINYGERKSGLARDLRSRKIKGFQRMVRAKITKFYSFISSVLGTKLKVISKNIK